MRHAKPTYLVGIEFYFDPGMGLCGVENDALGNTRTAQYLTTAEAVSWLTDHLQGEKWVRDRTKSPACNQETNEGGNHA